MKRDVVYVIKNSSKCNYIDLKYSLRTLYGNAKGIKNLIIVGFTPEFIDKTKIIHIEEHFDFYKERNIMECIKLACQDNRLTEEIIYYNDDFFLNQPFDFEMLPNYIRPYNLYDYVNSPRRMHLRHLPYTKTIEKTLHALEEKNLPILTYDIHKPMVFNRDLFPKAMDMFNWDDKDKLGLTYRSLYGNVYELPPTITKDKKLNDASTLKILEKHIEGHPFWSTNDFTKNSIIVKYLEREYYSKSKWEI